MTYSVLATVNNQAYNNQRFFMYKHGTNELTVFTLAEANALAEILLSYPTVFSNIVVVPREQDEIRLIYISDANSNFDFTFEMVFDDCPNILDRLTELDYPVCGIDFLETRRQIDENE